MIPILFPSNETSFTTNGLGRLADCTRCEVTEERNGVFELEFVYPISGRLYDQIDVGAVALCTHDDTGDTQPFEIYMRTAPINGLVTFNARHISYRLRAIPLRPFSAGSIAETFAAIPGKAMTACPFTFWTDKTTTAAFKVTVPQPVRSILGGQEGSVLDTFGGGEYKWDRFTVRLYANRGRDTDVTIRYGKNLLDIEETLDAANLYNSAVGYWEKDGQVVFGNVTKGSGITADPVTITMDLSSEFETAPTVAQLNAKVLSMLDASKPWIPKQNIKVDFVQLWQTEDYKDVAALQRCGLCDTVSVYYPALGVTAERVKVIRVVYDVLRDRYSEMELGEAQTSFAEIVAAQAISDVPTTSMMQSAINAATELIRGGLGGHIVMKPNANGEPEEILIMDTDDVNTAVKVWRWNLGGLGYSSDGVDGPYKTAITQNGQIVADFITTGTLIASLIKTGLLQGTSGGSYFNLDTGAIGALRGVIGPFTLSEAGLTYGSTAPMGEGASINNTGITYTTKKTISVPGLPEWAFRAVIDGTGFSVSRAASSDSWIGIFSIGIGTESGSVEINADGHLLINGRIPATIYKYTTDVLDYVLQRTFTVNVSSANGWELVGLRTASGMNLLADEHIKSVYYSGTTLTITKTSETAYRNHTCVAIFAKVI